MLQCIFICDRCRQEEELEPQDMTAHQISLCHDCFNQWNDIQQEVYRRAGLSREAFVDNLPQPDFPNDLWEVL